MTSGSGKVKATPSPTKKMKCKQTAACVDACEQLLTKSLMSALVCSLKQYARL